MPLMQYSGGISVPNLRKTMVRQVHTIPTYASLMKGKAYQKAQIGEEPFSTTIV